MKQPSFSAGVFFMLLSAAGLALTGLLGKLGLEGMDLTALIFWRFFASFLFCVVALWILGGFKEGLHLGNVKMHLLRAFFVLTSQYCYYYYLEKNTLLNAVVLINTGPLFIPIFERVIMKSKVGISTWVAIVVSFIGVLFVMQPDAGILSLMSWIGLLAGLSQGASQIVFGINAQAERTYIGVLYLLFLCAAFSLFPFLLMERSWVDTGTQGMVWFCWLIGALGMASLFNQFFRAAAYHHASPSKLACFTYFSVLVAGLLDWMIFAKIPNTFSLIGACLVIFGGILKIYLRYKILQKK